MYEFDATVNAMSNQELVDHGNKMMDETDQSIERSKKVIAETVEVETETAATLKSQTEQMSSIVNKLDFINFSIKKASKLVKELGRQIAIDRCIVFMLFLIVLGVIAIFIVKLVNPNSEDTHDVPQLAPSVLTNRRLLWNPNQGFYNKLV
ncbi:putative plant SNARE 11 [Apium graveolens]|uniref:putative plant SNARE 11 n=1 Tax=Apium graveolens TaxID=4045 RepID=UPI003D78D534